MSKRFIDTELWDKSAFNAASPKIKLLTIFITCKCDCVGVFKMAPMLINAYVGEIVTEEEILSIPCDIVKLKDGSFFLEKFCLFQYGELSENCKPHRKYIQLLKQYNLFERVLKGYGKGIDTLQEKEQEKEKEKEEDKSKSVEDRKEDFKKLTQNKWIELGGVNYLPESEAIEFTKYWVEHGPQDKKMRFEKEKSFGVGRRLGTWKKFYDQKNSYYSEGRGNA